MRTGREQHVPDSSNHSLYLTKLFKPPPHTQDNTRHTPHTPHTTQHTATQTHATQHQHIQHGDRERRQRQEKGRRKRRDKTRLQTVGYHFESHGFSCRSPALVLNFSPLSTFRALHGDHIVSTPFQTIVEEKHKKSSPTCPSTP